jgi:hypothetical protein
VSQTQTKRICLKDRARPRATCILLLTLSGCNCLHPRFHFGIKLVHPCVDDDDDEMVRSPPAQQLSPSSRSISPSGSIIHLDISLQYCPRYFGHRYESLVPQSHNFDHEFTYTCRCPRLLAIDAASSAGLSGKYRDDPVIWHTFNSWEPAYRYWVTIAL